MRQYFRNVLSSTETFTPNQMWEKFQKVCLQKARSILGVTKGYRKGNGESWIWNEETKKAISEKKTAFLEWQKCDHRNENEKTRLRLEYEKQKKNAKKIIAKTRATALDEFYNDLENISARTSERNQVFSELGLVESRHRDIFKIARQRRTNAKEITRPKYIKSSEGRLLTNDLDICNRWLEYCRNILNEEFPRSVTPDEEPSHEPVPEFTEDEVSSAVKAMGNGKALGPDCIPSEFWKQVGDVGCKWLTLLFNSVKDGNPMPDNWRTSHLIPLYKGKGDSRECNNYRSIKLMSHTMKIYERVLNSRLRQIVRLNENQCGFVEGKSTLDAIQSLRIIVEKYRDN